jgi:aspartyl-tRNA(Asn)/glutamyl-tRNA(Gln) amidotransferase subunit A
VFVDHAASGRGLVIAVKDNIDVRGMPTRAGGRHLGADPRTRDAECVRRLRAAGAAIVGKTGLYEYAMGGTSANPHYGDVRNPAAPGRDAGGSSSGSAAAVAARMCDAALGTDTLGSVRIPAAFCGVVGYKPPRSAMSRRGVFANSETLDTVGVVARDVRTAVRVRDLAGRPRRAERAPRRLRFAVPWHWLDGISDEVRDAFLGVAADLPGIALPPHEILGSVALTIARFEGVRVHREWLRRHPRLYGEELRAQLADNREVTGAQYRRALRDLALLRRRMRTALAAVDAVVTPTVPIPPPRLWRRGLASRRGLSDLTRPFNVSDSATFSFPIPGTGLPIGLQVAANEENAAIAAALSMERRLAG